MPLLAGLDESELEKITYDLKEREVAKGDPLIAEGQGGMLFLIVLEGHAEVSVNGQVVATLGPGDHFGETALIDPSAAGMATVVATTDVRFVRMTSWEFKPFVMAHPEVAWTIMQTLAHRIAALQRDAAAGS